jgi:hypothetical protein
LVSKILPLFNVSIITDIHRPWLVTFSCLHSPSWPLLPTNGREVALQPQVAQTLSRKSLSLTIHHHHLLRLITTIVHSTLPLLHMGASWLISLQHYPLDRNGLFYVHLPSNANTACCPIRLALRLLPRKRRER